MARYSIRNYNAFIKEARSKHGLSVPEARNAYKAVSAKLGHPARGVDVSRSPRIVAKAAKQAAGNIETAKRQKQKTFERISNKVARENKAQVSGKAKAKEFKSLTEYMNWFEDAEDYDYEEADSTVDY